MERLEKIIRPSIGIFTNLGPAHQEGFASDEEKLAEKMRLFENAEWLVGRAEDLKIPALAQGPQCFCWSENPNEPADLHVLKIEKLEGGRAKIWAKASEVRGRKTLARQDEALAEPPFTLPHSSFVIPFSDPASIENAALGSASNIRSWLRTARE